MWHSHAIIIPDWIVEDTEDDTSDWAFSYRSNCVRMSETPAATAAPAVITPSKTATTAPVTLKEVFAETTLKQVLPPPNPGNWSAWTPDKVHEAITAAAAVAAKKAIDSKGAHGTLEQVQQAAGALRTIALKAFKDEAMLGYYYGAVDTKNTVTVISCQAPECPARATHLILPKRSTRPGWYCGTCASNLVRHKTFYPTRRQLALEGDYGWMR